VNTGKVFLPNGTTFYFDLFVTNQTAYAPGVGKASGLDGPFAAFYTAPNVATKYRITTRPSCAQQDSCAYCEEHGHSPLADACYASGCACFAATCYNASCCSGAAKEEKREAYACEQMDTPLVLPGSSLIAFTVYDFEAPTSDYVKSVTIDDYRYYKTPLRSQTGDGVLTTISVSADQTVFQSTTVGTSSNNPTSTTELTDEQASKGAAFFFSPEKGYIEVTWLVTYTGTGTGGQGELLLGGDAALCTPPPPPPPFPPSAPPPPSVPPSPPPDIRMYLDFGDAANQLVDAVHSTLHIVTFAGDHPLDPGDWVVFVPLSDDGCSNALSAGESNGGPLDNTLSVAVTLDGGVDGTPSGRFALCVAEAPPGGFSGGLPQPADFTFYLQLGAIVTHEPPSTPPPSPPPPSLPPSLPPDIVIGANGAMGTMPNLTVTHNVPTTITFNGSHEFEPGDWVVFVPSSDEGCANATSVGAANGGSLDSSLSVTVTLQGGVDGTDSGTYTLCSAEAPLGGFPNGSPQAGDFDHHGHVTVVIIHAPPVAPPSFPPPQSPPSLPPFVPFSALIDLTTHGDKEWPWITALVVGMLSCCCCFWFLFALWRRRRKDQRNKEETPADAAQEQVVLNLEDENRSSSGAADQGVSAS